MDPSSLVHTLAPIAIIPVTSDMDSEIVSLAVMIRTDRALLGPRLPRKRRPSEVVTSNWPAASTLAILSHSNKIVPASSV